MITAVLIWRWQVIQRPNSSSFISFLKNLVDQDRLIFEQIDIGKKEPADIAYFMRWIIYLDTNPQHAILIVARSYNSWAELLSPDYLVGDFSKSIGKQAERARNSPDCKAKPIAKGKIKKFNRDMALRVERAFLQRERIIQESREILSYLLNSSPVEST